MYPVIRIPDDAANVIESGGTKPKFWFLHDEAKCLFKFQTEDLKTGAHWSEKAASELCGLIGLPHVPYELAEWKGHKGVVCPTFVPVDGRLVLGNELLGKIIDNYPGHKFFRTREHTLKSVLAIMRIKDIRLPIGWEGFDDVQSALDVFVGYLMLDVWIANQDRHHENWGLVISSEREVHLAPTYDHASSLGWNETDEMRQERLETRDRRRTLDAYVQKAVSAFYPSAESTKPHSTVEAFEFAGRMKPLAAKAWLQRLGQVTSGQAASIFSSIPEDRISRTAVTFALKVLQLNQRRLLSLELGK